LEQWLQKLVYKLAASKGRQDSEVAITTVAGYHTIGAALSKVCRKNIPPRVDHDSASSLMGLASDAVKPLRTEKFMTEKSIRRLKYLAGQQVLQEASVVCVTCVGAGAAILKNCSFTLVLSDEATQAPEHASLIPLSRMAKTDNNALFG
jgi:hypothetical protein